MPRESSRDKNSYQESDNTDNLIRVDAFPHPPCYGCFESGPINNKQINETTGYHPQCLPCKKCGINERQNGIHVNENTHFHLNCMQPYNNKTITLCSGCKSKKCHENCTAYLQFKNKYLGPKK
jgi:hypothetical protein